MVKLKSCEGEEFECQAKALKHSKLICNAFEQDETNDYAEPITLPSIKSSILKLVIEWCQHHKNSEFPEPASDVQLNKIEPLSVWDENFLKIEQAALMELILAADYLIIEPLKDMCCKVIASWIPGKSPDQLRKLFNIKNDFTPEEEEQIRKENAWCE